MGKILLLILFPILDLTAQIEVVSYGQNWKYFDDGNVNSFFWKDSSFIDNSWKNGNGLFGYGFNELIDQEVSFGNNSYDKHITTYFRKKITILDNSTITVNLKFNDAIVFYLNGIEVYRHNLPSGNIAFETLASTYFGGLANVSFTIPSNLFEKGTNVFAAEVHQISSTSSNLGFDCQMTQRLNHPLSPKIYINEVMSSNDRTSINADGNNSDWVEIFNATASSINLQGYYFTDVPSDKTKFKIEENIIIPSNSHYIFWANSNTNSAGNYLDFSLSSHGEYIALVHPDKETIIDSVSFPALKADVSYGRLFDGDSLWRYFSPATFDDNNNPYLSFLGILKPPSLSHRGGYYDTEFDMTISQDNVGAEILYTLDGSYPSLNTIFPKTYQYKVYYFSPNFSQGQMMSKYYSTPIHIYDRTIENNVISGIPTANKYKDINSYLPNFKVSKSTPVRAMAVKEGFISSDVVTNSYFVNNDGKNPFEIPVVSLNTDADLLFEYDYGIHVNGGSVANYFDTTEIPISFEFIENDSLSFQQNLGAQLHGGSSKEHPLKSFRFYARSEYDKNNSIEYPVFPNTPSLKRFLLRNSGNDFSMSDPTRSLMFKDGFIHKSVANLKFETQEYRPTATYLNGEFWGILNLRERYDKYYFKSKYGIEETDIDIIEYFEDVKEGSLTNYQNFLLYFIVNNDFASNPARMIYADENMDLDNYIDYQITQIFYHNQDWPPNNTKYWRMNNPAKISDKYGMDGKWRWVLFDTDFSMLDQTERITNAKNNQTIFSKLMDNSDFKDRFVTRYTDLLNTTFKPIRLLSMIDSMAQTIELTIDDHIDRWRGIPSISVWNTSINEVKTFVTNRGDLELNVLKNLLGKNGTHEITLQVNHAHKGFVQLNTVEINNTTEGISSSYAYPWSGKYVNDLQVKLIARPKLGYKFSHWEYNGQSYTDSIIYITSNVDYEVNAFFEDDFVSENPLPQVKNLSSCFYRFDSWNSSSPAGTFPTHLAFVYMNQADPLIDAKIAGFTFGGYSKTSKTRINGLNENGMSFINTGSGQSGYEATRLGGAILALNTIGYDSLILEFSAGTVKSNSRVYDLSLEYRIGDKLNFTPLIFNAKEVIYNGNISDGHETKYSLYLPDTILNKEYIQLFWRYHYTDNRRSSESGARDEIRLDDIIVKRIYKLDSTKVNSSTLIENYDYINLNNITLNQSATEVKANNAILLEPGFNSGETVFKADIQTCE
jgi:hypothetical protein